MKTLKLLSLLIFSLFLVSTVSAIVYGTFDESADYISEVRDSFGYITGVTINEEVSVNFEVVFVFPLETLSVTLYGSSLPLEGVILLPVNEYSSYNTYTISNSLEAGTYQIVILGSDTIGIDFSYLTLIINPVEEPQNHAPTLSPINDKVVKEGELLEFIISATDVDGGDTLTYSASNLPTGAILTDNTDGTATFSWIPDYTQSGTYNDVRFIVSDGIDSDSETITITVKDVNRNPEIDPISDQQINEGADYSYQVIATDADEDTLTYYLIQELQELKWLSINPSCGLITGTAPEVDEDTPYNIKVKVSDGKGGYDIQSYILTVKNIPEQPEELRIISEPNTEVNENEFYEYQVEAEGGVQPYEFSVTGADWLSIDSQTGLLTGTAPEIGENADFNIVVKVTDENRNFAEQSYSLTVNVAVDEDDEEKEKKKEGEVRVIGEDAFEEQEYLDQFNKPKIIYLEDDDEPVQKLNWWQRLIAWLKKIFGFD